MKIESVKRPWIKDEGHRHNHRNGDRSHYQSTEWKNTTKAFLAANPYCIECQKEGNKVKATVSDHIKQRIFGGTDDWSNLQPMCQHHHDSNSARQRNEMYKSL